jgi:pyruvate dehydrogenase E2 component (dihydrolipoamide acetyltransferase)
VGIAKEVRIPDIGDFTDVDVIEVLVSAGDRVETDDPLITLESDKATMDVPSPHGGVVKDLKIKVGDKVSEGDAIVTLDVADGQEGGDVAANEVSPKSAGKSAPERAEAEVEATEPAKEREKRAPAKAAPVAGPAEGGEIVEVRVPDIGDFTDVDVIEVLVSAGDRVETDDPLITLESDKATMDMARGAARVPPPPSPARPGEVALEPMTARSPEAKKAAPEAKEAPRPSPTAGLAGEIDETAIRRVHASPSVRRFARELGVDLGQVHGSGSKGRIVKEDVQAYVKGVMRRPAAAPGPGFVLPEMPEIDFSKFGEIEHQPLSRIKKIAGPSLHRSWLHVPHVTQHEEADITDLESFRQELKEEASRRGVRLTLLAFLLKASVAALKEHPYVNASLDPSGESLILKRYYHIGVAVDTPEGLVVPVIRDVDEKGVFDLAAELGEASAKAREKKLAPADIQGASFTISSLGGIGGTSFTPIVNAPEVAILGVSRARMQPVYSDGGFVPRLMLPLSFSYDHRVIDGAQAARFTSYLAQVLADVRRLLL